MTPDVDYLQTSSRPSFGSLPEPVRALVDSLAGSAVAVALPPVTSGFTGAYAGLLALRDGRRVFAKAAGPAAPFAARAIPREASVLALLAGRATAPRLVGAGGTGDWEAIVVEAIDGRLPGCPWTRADVDAAHAACVVAASLTTAEVRAVTGLTLAAEVGGDPAALLALDELASGARTWPTGIPPVPVREARELARLGHGAEEVLTGDRLVHGDLRPDNMLVTPHGAVRIVDWNWVCRGPAWADIVGLWPLMAHHGVDVERLAATSPLLDGTDPEAVDAFLAVIVGHMVDDCVKPTFSGRTEVRDHQRQMARTFLALLARRRGWAPQQGRA